MAMTGLKQPGRVRALAGACSGWKRRGGSGMGFRAGRAGEAGVAPVLAPTGRGISARLGGKGSNALLPSPDASKGPLHPAVSREETRGSAASAIPGAALAFGPTAQRTGHPPQVSSRAFRAWRIGVDGSSTLAKACGGRRRRAAGDSARPAAPQAREKGQPFTACKTGLEARGERGKAMGWRGREGC